MQGGEIVKYACFLSTGDVKQIVRMDQIVYAFIDNGSLFVGTEPTSGTKVSFLEGRPEGPFEVSISVLEDDAALQWLVEG